MKTSLFIFSFLSMSLMGNAQQKPDDVIKAAKEHPKAEENAAKADVRLIDKTIICLPEDRIDSAKTKKRLWKRKKNF